MSDVKIAANSDGSRLHISLLWFGPVKLRRAEAWGFLRHPLMMFFFVLIFAIIVIANNDPASVKVPFALRAAIYALAPLSSTALVMLWIELRLALARQHPVRINLAPVVFVAILCIVPVSDEAQRIFIVPAPFTWPELIAKVIFYAGLAEILLACAIVFFAEGVLKEMRERAAARKSPGPKTAARTGAPILRFRLFGLKPVDVSYGDFLTGLIHPKAQIVFVLYFMAVLAGNASSASAQGQIIFRTAFYFFSVMIGWAVWVGVVGLWRAFGRKVDGVIDIPTSLTMLVSTLLVAPIADVYDRAWITPEAFDWARLVARMIFYLTLAHVSTALVMALVAEDIIADVKARRKTAEATVPPAPEPPKAPQLTVGGISFDADRLLMLQARRNVVELVLRDTVHRISGPLSERVAELPPDMGRMVHRSVWVAEARISRHRREGREIALDLDGGHSVTIALSRQAELLPWLRELAEQRN